MLLHVSVSKTPGPDVIIDCPHCLTRQALARTEGQTEHAYLFFIIPLLVLPHVKVICEHCQAEFLTNIKLERLDQTSVEELTSSLSFRGVKSNGRVKPWHLWGVLILTVCTLCLPVFSLVFAIIFLVMARREHVAFRVTGWVLLALSLLGALVFVISIFSHP